MALITHCVHSLAEQFSFLRDIHVKQFLLLGLENAGKTTLLYRLKIPQWKKNEITAELAHIKDEKKDPSYHYEELSSSAQGTFAKYGIWDIPGNEDMMRLWPMFYKYIRITAVIFVVDAAPPPGNFTDKIEELDRARRQIQFLLNEDELRRAAFILILNIREPLKDSQAEAEYKDALQAMLGINTIVNPDKDNPNPNYDRFAHFFMNCAAVSDPDHKGKWLEILKKIKEIHDQVGEGAVVEKEHGMEDD